MNSPLIMLAAYANAWLVSVNDRTARSERGATATEYALIVAGIAIAVFGAVQAFGGDMATFWNKLAGDLKLNGA